MRLWASSEDLVWREVDGNHFPCDLCDRPPVGWIVIRPWDRSLGGRLAPVRLMVCAMHISLGTSVHQVVGMWTSHPEFYEGKEQDDERTGT